MEKVIRNAPRGKARTSRFACVVVLALVGAASTLTALGEMPARYMPLDWLDTAGAQWILTGYTPKCTDRFEMSVRFKPSTLTQCLYCSRGANTGIYTMTAFLLDGTTLRFDRNAYGTALFKPEMDTDCNVVVDFATCESRVNDVPAYTNANATAFTPGSPLTLFASHEAGMSLSETSSPGAYAHYRFYSFRVYSAAGKLVREYLCQYVASLPAKGKPENWVNVSERPVGKTVNHFTRKMETPKANSRIYWYSTTSPYNLENSLLADVAGQLLEKIYLQKIREDAGAAYSPYAGGSVSMVGDKVYTSLIGVVDPTPEKTDMALRIMHEELIPIF